MDTPAITEEEYQVLLAKLKQKTAALQEQKQLLKLALDAAQIGLWSLDVAKNYLVWDTRMCDIFDAPFEEKKDINTFLSRLAPEDSERVQEALASCINDGDFYEISYTIIWPSDGSKHFIHARGYMENQKLSGVCFKLLTS